MDDVLLSRCKRDRDDAARILDSYESGAFTSLRGAPGGAIEDDTEEQKSALRRVIDDLEKLISKMEARGDT